MSDMDNDGNIYESPGDADGCILEIDAWGESKLQFDCIDSKASSIVSVYIDVTDVHVMYAKLGEWLAKYE